MASACQLKQAQLIQRVIADWSGLLLLTCGTDGYSELPEGYAYVYAPDYVSRDRADRQRLSSKRTCTFMSDELYAAFAGPGLEIGGSRLAELCVRHRRAASLCTHGLHRSQAIARRAVELLTEQGYDVAVVNLGLRWRWWGAYSDFLVIKQYARASGQRYVA